MTREIVFDTETTGLDALGADRIVEIGCVELLNTIPTGQTFHVYLNPERDMPEAAFAVHGLSSAFLADKPVFAAVAEAFLDFVGDARLIAHNASFDLAFLNAELRRLGHDGFEAGRVVDTLLLARRKFPFGSNSLDALCQRFGIDATRRVKHGALLDAEILAEVYLELMGGRQAGLDLTTAVRSTIAAKISADGVRAVRARPAPLPSRLTPADIAAHEVFAASLPGAAIWLDYGEFRQAGVG